MRPPDSSNKLWRRRDVIKLLGATAITGPVILRGTTAKAATSKVIKIGYVSSQTGALAPVAEADPFILDQIRTVLARGVTNRGGKAHAPNDLDGNAWADAKLGFPPALQEADYKLIDNRLHFGCGADRVVR